MTQIILSGVQTTGSLHLGNYLGAISNWTLMQEEYNCLFFLADLHAITIDQHPQSLQNSILSTTALYLACGINPNKSIIFPQSMVPQHTELSWIFTCISPMGWLKRMTQFKDKAQNQDTSSLGLLSYPVLMAADILLYKADLVPTGEDQKQHLELTRDIAGAINKKFNKEVFKLPKPLIQGIATRIMSLKDGRRKMSKSDIVEASRINLTDSAELIAEKIKKAKTDSISYVSYEPELRPEISNLINIYSAINQEEIKEIVNRYESLTFSRFKADLTDIVIEKLAPINNQYQRLIEDKIFLQTTLKSGAMKAQEIAQKNLNEIKELFGFII